MAQGFQRGTTSVSGHGRVRPRHLAGAARDQRLRVWLLGAAATVGVVPAGTAGGAGGCLGFFASLLPCRGLDMLLPSIGEGVRRAWMLRDAGGAHRALAYQRVNDLVMYRIGDTIRA